jgi:hypothetical protein
MFNTPLYSELSTSQYLLHQAARNLMPELQKKLEKIGLRTLLEQFCSLNQSSFAPYHNAYHSFFVVTAVSEGAEYYHLDLESSRALHVAALFHDANHSAGQSIDAVNIEQALMVVDAVSELPDNERQLSKQLIRATLRPSPINVQWSLLETILREADLMQAYESDDAVMTALYSGLHLEIESSINKKMSVLAFSDLSREWMDINIIWDSEWAQAKALRHDWASLKARLDRLLSQRTDLRVPY